VLVVTGWAATGELAGAHQATLRQVLDSLRPIGNALAGGAASRLDCRLDWYDQRRERLAPSQPGGAPPVGPSVMTEGTVNPGAADFVVTFSAGHSTRCRLRAQFPVELLEGGRLAAVQGNGATATVEGELPEGDGEHPSFTRAWLGRNWCGSGNVSLRVGGPGGAVIPARTLQRPACADPGKPSTLEPTRCPSGQTANELGRVFLEHVAVLWLVLAARLTQRTSSCLPPTTRHSSSACCPATPTSTSSPAAVYTSGGIKGAGACSSATRPVRWSASTWLAGCSPGCDGLAGERRGADLASRR
jgi:hypothetical protein